MNDTVSAAGAVSADGVAVRCWPDEDEMETGLIHLVAVVTDWLTGGNRGGGGGGWLTYAMDDVGVKLPV